MYDLFAFWLQFGGYKNSPTENKQQEIEQTDGKF